MAGRADSFRPETSKLAKPGLRSLRVILNLALWPGLRMLFAVVEVRRRGPLILNVPVLRTFEAPAFIAALVGFVGIGRF